MVLLHSGEEAFMDPFSRAATVAINALFDAEPFTLDSARVGGFTIALGELINFNNPYTGYVGYDRGLGYLLDNFQRFAELHDDAAGELQSLFEYVAPENGETWAAEQVADVTVHFEALRRRVTRANSAHLTLQEHFELLLRLLPVTTPVNRESRVRLFTKLAGLRDQYFNEVGSGAIGKYLLEAVAVQTAYTAAHGERMREPLLLEYRDDRVAEYVTELQIADLLDGVGESNPLIKRG
jgi:hypothetical protein